MSYNDDGPRFEDRPDGLGLGPDDLGGESPIAALARAAWQLIMAVGVASVVLGLIALFWTRGTLVVAGVLFGIYLLVSGIMQLVAAFAEGRPTGARVIAALVGVISIMLGIFCFFSALESVVLLSLWIGIGFLLRGLTLTMAAATAPSGAPGRGLSIFLGVLVAIAGLVMICWPVGSIATLTVLAGWWLLIVGVVEIVHAFQLRSATKNA